MIGSIAASPFRIILLAAYIVALAPIARRVWSARRVRTASRRLQYERLEIDGIVTFIAVAGAGLCLIYAGYMHLGAGLAIGSISGGIVSVYAHIMQRVVDE